MPPRGGGRFIVTIEPAAKLTRVDLPSRGSVHRRHAKAVTAGLPHDIAKRELATVREMLNWSPDEVEAVELPEAYGPGNIVTLEIESEHVTEVFAGVGRRGVRAEAVAAGAADSARRYLAAPDVPVGDCLADQLLLPNALAGGGSYTTVALTRHSATNIEVIRMFLNVQVEAREVGPDVTTIEVRSPMV